MSIASFFKPSGSSSSSGTKRPREGDEGTSSASVSSSQSLPQPLTLCAWNANSLLNRIEKDRAQLSAFLSADTAPDLVFISEVRMPAAGPPGCKKDDGKPRRRNEMSKANAAQSREAETIATFLRQHNYRAYYTLSDSKYAGAALLVRRDCAQPSDLRYTLCDNEPPTQHTSEGRVIRCSFADFDLLGTYSPNNGTSETSFERRRKWDEQCAALLHGRAQSSTTKPLIWLGDLNVAAAWNDVGPDPDWFRNQNGQTALHADDKGQPGFTANEQSRFAALLDTGGLIDAYRLLHPTADWQRDVTWRGTPGVHNPAEGRYYNKGMRIDYVLVSRSLAPRIKRAIVHGKGPDRHGFLGSDHCPLIVELAPPAAGEEKVAGDN